MLSKVSIERLPSSTRVMDWIEDKIEDPCFDKPIVANHVMMMTINISWLQLLEDQLLILELLADKDLALEEALL